MVAARRWSPTGLMAPTLLSDRTGSRHYGADRHLRERRGPVRLARGRRLDMKLYFSPGACSLSPHIVLREAGIAADFEQVDLKTKKTKAGADFIAVSPKGQVPALVLDDGRMLTEGPAIVQYLADRKPDSGLAPPAGTFDRYCLQEWL